MLINAKSKLTLIVFIRKTKNLKAIMIEREIKKKSKRLIPKIEQRRLIAIALKGAMDKSKNCYFIIGKMTNLIEPKMVCIMSAPILFSPTVF